jgi:hypothetical protein
MDIAHRVFVCVCVCLEQCLIWDNLLQVVGVESSNV